jgi:hypothetical protein
MKNKKNYLMWALCSCAGALMSLSACSDSENLVDEETVGSESAVYAKVIITVPTSSTTTRALTRAEETSQTLEGTANKDASDEESTVKNLYIYAFDSNGLFVEMATINTPNSYTPTDGSSAKYRSDVAFKNLSRPTGNDPVEYKLLAIANLTKAPNAIVGSTTMSEFLKDAELTDGDWMLPSSDGKELEGKFVMASRDFKAAGEGTPEVTMQVYSYNSKDTPATAAITVERLHAKYSLTIDFNSEASSDAEKLTKVLNNTVTDKPYVKLTVDGYYPFNISTNSYVFRHRRVISYETGSTNEKEWDGTYTYCNVSEPSSWNATTRLWENADYVVDPDWASKKGITSLEDLKKRSIYKNPIHGVDNSSYIKVEKSDLDVIGYSYENTMPAENQYVENSTGILFRAKLEPQNVVTKTKTTVVNDGDNTSTTTPTTTKPTTYFYYNETFFDSWDALLETYSGLDELAKTEEVAIGKSKDLAEKGVYIFAPDDAGNYYCYYTYIVKHFTPIDSGDAVNSSFMAPMKFVTVRNNWYTISVTGVSRIGSPNPDPYVNETPPTPDESTVIYLQVTLSVKEWVPRDNTGIVLQ